LPGHRSRRAYRFTIRPLPEDEGGAYLIQFPDLPDYLSDGS
jgi:antitoxin HicB